MLCFIQFMNWVQKTPRRRCNLMIYLCIVFLPTSSDEQPSFGSVQLGAETTQYLSLTEFQF